MGVSAVGVDGIGVRGRVVDEVLSFWAGKLGEVGKGVKGEGDVGGGAIAVGCGDAISAGEGVVAARSAVSLFFSSLVGEPINCLRSNR